ncbi:polysaccharide deacetylase family protein [Ferdinandcohnia quinoae]|uniref:Polysaccharide deacetylase family protein n=1 Tax=Fredinandcohnia quinoae TaxID=2918902 RepID=A0AAW5E9X6_9BACI|nr:polysaccharide deacetylase family protein [Fredinandcohnia sp. SECRCQ15]MCH1625923.1 polysaccharide deacetylase family protein [Fredinandcohnia sp. SECRCQ15]
MNIKRGTIYLLVLIVTIMTCGWSDMDDHFQIPAEDSLKFRELYRIENQKVKPVISYEDESKRKQVALTFDDGPHPKNTQLILDILKKHQANATFFVLGNRVNLYPDTLKKIYEEGHEIGNHSWTHTNFTSIGLDGIRQEVTHTNTAIQEILGYKPQLVRPPYGAVDETVQGAAKLPLILWSVDSLDWKLRSSSAIVQEVLSNVSNGSIVLMHDIHSATPEAVDAIISNMKKKGYHFVTVSQLLKLEDGQIGAVSGQLIYSK